MNTNINNENFEEDKKQSKNSSIQTKKREDKNKQKEEEKDSLNYSILKNALQSSDDDGKDEEYKGQKQKLRRQIKANQRRTRRINKL